MNFEDKLIAFFAANATEEDVERHRYGHLTGDEKSYKRRTIEQAKMIYAKTMLEKYKEFLTL